MLLVSTLNILSKYRINIFPTGTIIEHINVLMVARKLEGAPLLLHPMGHDSHDVPLVYTITYLYLQGDPREL